MRIREAIKLRYRLGPYLYHTLQTKGMYISPVIWQATNPANSWEEYVDFSKNENEFMLGPSLLVCPNFNQPPIKTTNCLLPKGLWCSPLSKECIDIEKGQKIKMEVDDDVGLAVFQRQGTIVPFASEAGTSIEETRLKPLILRYFLFCLF